jgi:hypothetical protein
MYLHLVGYSGRQPVARGPHVTLATFFCGPSHDLGISQCGKGNNFLLLRTSVRANNRQKYVEHTNTYCLSVYFLLVWRRLVRFQINVHLTISFDLPKAVSLQIRKVSRPDLIICNVVLVNIKIGLILHIADRFTFGILRPQYS